MHSLKELEEKGIEFIVHSNRPVNESLIRRQIDMNGALNDYNLGQLTQSLGVRRLDSLVASIYDTQRGNEVNLSFSQRPNVVPYCDFPMANSDIDLTLDKQSVQLYDYLGKKYIHDLGLEVPPIFPTKYSTQRISEEGKEAIEVRKTKGIQALNVHDYWRSIDDSMRQENINYPELAKFLFTFQHDLKRGFNEGSCDLNENLYLFVNLSNFQAMIHHNYKQDKEETQTTDEKVFLDYSNKLAIANMSSDFALLEEDRD